MSPKSNVEKRVKDIRRNTRKKYSAEEKIRIILEGLRGEEIIASVLACSFDDMRLSHAMSWPHPWREHIYCENGWCE